MALEKKQQRGSDIVLNVVDANAETGHSDASSIVHGDADDVAQQGEEPGTKPVFRRE